jgi:hypothetical protein
MKALIAAVVGLQAAFLAACSFDPVSSLALGAVVDDKDPVQRTEKEIRGVVRGLWSYSPAQNTDRLTRLSIGASEIEAAPYAERYQVRVGVWYNAFTYHAIKVVPLPEGWTYSLGEVVNDGRTVNVGDIVDLRTVVGERIIPLVRIVRKCDQPPSPDESHDWQLGCKSYTGFDDKGYAGDVNVMLGW